MNIRDTNKIEINNISKSYGENKVLKNFSMEISYDKITSIMAPSGKGKTTLLRILMGLENQDEGEVRGLHNLKKSAVFQEDRLCENLSAGANIKLVNTDLTFESINEAMNKMGLEECEHQLVSELSGGMRRRVAILRGLLSYWDILFLDEPFKGLDKIRKELVMEYTKTKCKGKTVILVTHNKEEADFLADNKVEL